MELHGLTYRYPGADTDALRDVSLEIRPGECHVVTGPTGSGKSTLALALGGMLPGAGPRERRDAGLILQNPATQLLASSVGAEAAFGLENLCVEPSSMPRRVRDALGRVGLDKPLGTDPRVLSMGEKYRLLVAAQLVMGRGLIVLDEPSGQLDRRGLADLAALISALKGTGVSFAVMEHEPGAYADVTDAMWGMDGGAIVPASVDAGSPHTEYAREYTPPDGSGPLVVAEGLACSYDGGAGCLWGGLDMELTLGARVAVTGPNGAGKTSLLRCMTGGMRPASGRLSVLGGEPSLQRLRGRVGLMPQDPDAQLFEDTVLKEVSFTMRRLGYGAAGTDERVRGVLDSLGIADLSGASPHRLSFGQKRLVCLASVIAARPELLLLDSPMSGLDHDRRARVLGLLDGYVRDGGTVVATSHDTGELRGWPDTEIKLAGGVRHARVA